MTELRSLLAFMDPEDRERAMRRYEAMFDAAAQTGETDALISRLGSPVRLVLSIERELREAQSRGEVPFADADELPAPAVEYEPTVEYEPEPVPEYEAEPEYEPEPEIAISQVVREAAEALEREEIPIEEPQPEAAPEPIEPENDFPIGEYAYSEFLESGSIMPEEDDGWVQLPLFTAESFPAEEEPVPEPVPEEPAAEELWAEPDSGDIAAPEAAPERLAEEEYIPAAEPEASEPTVWAESGEYGEETEEIPPEPAEEENSLEGADSFEEEDEFDEDAELDEEDEDDEDDEESAPPSTGRVVTAVAATLLMIVPWVMAFSLCVFIGGCIMAAGFGFSTGGAYLVGYVFGGAISYMPDLLLTCGVTLACMAAALLLLWTGIWVAAGGCALIVRLSGRLYRKILRGPAEEEEDEADD